MPNEVGYNPRRNSFLAFVHWETDGQQAQDQDQKTGDVDFDKVQTSKHSRAEACLTFSPQYPSWSISTMEIAFASSQKQSVLKMCQSK